MERVDAHCHFWELSRGDYTWLDVSNPDLAPIARDFLPAEMKLHREAADIDRVVVVQAAATEAETDYLLGLADQHDEIGGVVGWADLESEKVELRLKNWATNPKFNGIRPMLQDIEDTNWILGEPQIEIGRILEKLDLRFDALIEPRHLPAIYQFCDKYPDLAVVIDHAAKPKAALAGDREAFVDWSTYMKKIAGNPNVYCKLSGLLTELQPAAQVSLHGLLDRYINVLLEAFGPQRLMWGSDWPVLTLASDYQSWLNLSHTLLQNIDGAARDQIFGGTASAFYGLGDKK